MIQDVEDFCKSCMTCKRSKPSNQKPYGLLNPLPVPSLPWEAIGIDFVGPLLESQNRDGSFDSIIVIIDLLTSMVHLVPSRINYNAKQVAELVFTEVYKHHGMPKLIVSDRDVLFTSTFWTHLHRLIGIVLRLSSAYHPESDGSTERANRTVTQMLRQCIGPSQKDWVMKLPAIEFAINLARSDSTGYAPFFLNTGRMPRSLIWNNPSKDEYPGVRIFAQKVKNAIMSAHDSIIAARVKQTRDANRRRRPAPFTLNDLVYISTKNISLPKRLARKLAPKYIGPYRITRDFGNSSYQIDLPSNLKQRGIHPVFYASLLRIHEPNDDRLFPGRLDSQITDLGDQEGHEWAVDKILSHKGSKENSVFEMKWKSGDVTWVPYGTIAHLDAMKSYFEAQGVERVSDLKEETGVPPNDPQVHLGSLDPRRKKSIKRRKNRKGPTKNPTFPQCGFTHLSFDTAYFNPQSLFTPSTLKSSPYHSIMLQNQFAIMLDNGNVVLREDLPGERVLHHLFTPAQLEEILTCDANIRRHQLPRDPIILPAGYLLFVTLWNQDAHCPWRFSTFNPLDGSYATHGAAIPRARLIPPNFSNSQASECSQFLVDQYVHSGMRRIQVIGRRQVERMQSRALAGGVRGRGPFGRGRGGRGFNSTGVSCAGVAGMTSLYSMGFAGPFASGSTQSMLADLADIDIHMAFENSGDLQSQGESSPT